MNDDLKETGIYLRIERWENFLDAVADQGLQEEYNQKVRDCDIFVSLFRTKTGKYTEEEFDVAYESFQKTGKPVIFTFFHDAKLEVGKIDPESMKSLWEFQAKLKEIKHYSTSFKSTEDLCLQFRKQLEKLRAENRI